MLRAGPCGIVNQALVLVKGEAGCCTTCMEEKSASVEPADWGTKPY